MQQFRGTGVALVTPFHNDHSVDTDALRNIVRYCIDDRGIDYLVVLGTTGESVTLSETEKQMVMDTVLSENAGSVPLVLGVGGNNTAHLVKVLRHTSFQGFDAILSVSPYYNKPTQEGIYQHYKALASVTPKPLILYNVPSRTGSNVLPATVVRLANDCPEIIGIKEASGDLNQIQELLEHIPENFQLISGDDFTALQTILLGGVGIISVLGQGLPVHFSQMIQLGLAGKEKAAYELFYTLKIGMELIFEEGNPAGIKAIFEILGLSTAKVRLPLVEASVDLKARIDQFMKKFTLTPTI